MPSFGGVGALGDPWILATVLVPLLGFGGAGWMYFSTEAKKEELAQDLEAARADSARYADIQEKTELLRARSDSVSDRVQIIQDIDEGRYVWPHVLDEIGRALPDYTWLTGVSQITGGTEPVIQITGQAGNNDAVAVFMDQLVSSAFIRNVRLIRTTQTLLQGQVVYDFELEATYTSPPLDVVETVPLFGEEAVDTTTAAPDTVSGNL